MPTKKKKEKDILKYRGKPLLRNGNQIYYGNPEDKYIVSFKIEETVDLLDLPVSSRIIIELMTNEGPKSKLIKQAERDGLYKALDIGCFWLEDALENG